MAEAATPLEWRKSTRCESGACVEVAPEGERILMRGTADPTNEVAFLSPVWQAFIEGVRKGEFDR